MQFYSTHGGPSDGYLEFVFKAAARELFGVQVSGVQYSQGAKNTENFKEVVLEVCHSSRFC